MKLPMLFARTNTGAIQTWTIEVDGNKFRTHYGQIDGAIQTTEWTLCDGKNTGKKNATSNEDQAVKEAKATWKKKKDSGLLLLTGIPILGIQAMPKALTQIHRSKHVIQV